MKWLMLLALTCGPLLAQSDLVLPWVTNNSTFRGTIVVNNLGDTEASLTMVATRASNASDTELTETITTSVSAFGQLLSAAGDLFTTLGEGSAYSVRITTDGDIRAAYVNTSTLSQSGSSPSQANASAISEAASTLLFNRMNIGTGFSSVVLYNTAAAAQDVTIYAYQGGQRFETTMNVGANAPAAATVESLFPDLTGDMFVVANGTSDILGTAFIFNEFEFLEPAMTQAQAISSAPNPDGGGGGGTTVSFIDQIVPIIEDGCGRGSCHLNGSAQRGLALDSNVFIENTVNVSNFSGNGTLIIPGNADDSYLYRKLLAPGDASYSGVQMPSLGPKTSDSDLALIRTWITEGANNN